MIENDAKWNELNKSLLEAVEQNDLHSMPQLYNEMAYLVAKEGKGVTYLLKARNKAELMMMKSVGIIKVKILTARDLLCPYCSPLEGKILTIDEALETMPIPHPNCTTDVFRSGHGFCRCIYVAYRDKKRI